MTYVEQEINNIRLEIIMSELIIKLEMRNGVEFEEIKRKKLVIKELKQKIIDLLESHNTNHLT